MTIEDETGVANLVVHAKTWERFRKIARHASAWIVHGRVETNGAVLHVVARRIEDLSHRLAPLAVKPRDFR